MHDLRTIARVRGQAGRRGEPVGGSDLGWGCPEQEEGSSWDPGVGKWRACGLAQGRSSVRGKQ